MPIAKRRGKLVACTLSRPADGNGTYLTTALWTEAVIKAHTIADTLRQMIDELPLYKAAAEPGDWLRDVFALLDKPRGELQALAFMIRRDSSRA